MLVPIALGLSWPERLADVDVAVRLDRAAQSWDFHPLDDEAFPAVRLARRGRAAGGTSPAVYNAANEVGVDAFHEGAIRFTDIVDTVERVVVDARPGATGDASSVEGVLAADRWARRRAAELLGVPTQHRDVPEEAR